jgi:hypothetical protein
MPVARYENVRARYADGKDVLCGSEHCVADGFLNGRFSWQVPGDNDFV